MKNSTLFDLPLQYDKGAVRESNGSFLCATTKQDGEAIAKAVNSYEEHLAVLSRVESWLSNDPSFAGSDLAYDIERLLTE